MATLQLGQSYLFTHFAPKRSQFEENVEDLSNHGLNSIELLFLGCVLGVPKPGPILYYPTNAQAESVAKLLNDFSISIHAPYIMSLTTIEKRKIQTTKAHFTRNLKLGHLLGAKYIVFHVGSRKNHKTSNQVKTVLNEIMITKEKQNYTPRLAPEVAGKVRSFSGFREIVEVAHECGTLFCWDFSHDFARGGDVITESGILKRLELIDDNIDLKGDRLPIHLSGIIGDRWGEVSHTLLGKGSGVPWRLFLSVLQEQGWVDRMNIIYESKGIDESNPNSRIMDVLKIKEFIETGDFVKTYTPKKSRLDAFWK